MREPLEDRSTTSLVKAIEENAVEFLLALGRAGGAEERNEPQIQWVIGGSPIDYHNAVVRADLAPGVADEVIVASRERMRARGVPGTWHVGPAMRPAGLGMRLVAHGFANAGDDIGSASTIGDPGSEDAAPPICSGEEAKHPARQQVVRSWLTSPAISGVRGMGPGSPA